MQYAPVNVNTATTHAVVAAVPGRRIRLLGYVLVAAGSVTVQWASGSTARTGAMSLIDGHPLTAPPGGDTIDPIPYLQTEPGEALNLVLGGAVQVSGHVVYDLA